MAEQVTVDKLMDDLRTVIHDAEALLKATSAQTGEKLGEVRARAEESLRQARTRLAEAQQTVTQHAHELTAATDQYVRENPWRAVGIAAGVGVLIGLLLRRH
jgi:ElaB/YqjD/DUF883 family membrane-anchored ribosome-binding protein